jgi:hypothetical protein
MSSKNIEEATGSYDVIGNMMMKIRRNYDR